MNPYHKIKTVYQRDPENKYKTLINGQYATPEFSYLAMNEWLFTEKVDGTNIRIMFDGETITFGGKSNRAQLYAPLVTRLQERFLSQIDTFKECFPDGVCLYGEGYGAKIQKGGGKYRQDVDFVLFDIKIGDWWLQHEDVCDVATKLNVDVVPIIGRGTLPEMVHKARLGFDSVWGDFNAEGIVARPTIELFARNGNRIITKIKTKDF